MYEYAVISGNTNGEVQELINDLAQSGFRVKEFIVAPDSEPLSGFVWIFFVLLERNLNE